MGRWQDACPRVTPAQRAMSLRQPLPTERKRAAGMKARLRQRAQTAMGQQHRSLRRWHLEAATGSAQQETASRQQGGRQQ